jgi:hypothetical protein
MALKDSHFNLVAKVNRSKFLLPLVLSSIPIVGISYDFLKNGKEEVNEFKKSVFIIGIVILLLFCFSYFLYKYFFDKKIKLAIDNEGIWTPKYGKLKWQEVSYIYQIERRGKFISKELVIKLHKNEKKIKLETTFFDKNDDEILESLKECSSKFDVQFLIKEI